MECAAVVTGTWRVSHRQVLWWHSRVRLTAVGIS
jgi:hypothetical protein